MVMQVLEKAELCPDNLIMPIKEKKAEIEKILIKKEVALKDAPKGKLRIDQKGNSPQYYYKNDSSTQSGFYLKRAQDALAAALAQKDYDIKLINELKVEKAALERFLNDYRPERIDEIFLSLHDFRKSLIQPVKLLEEDYVKRWTSVEYPLKSFEENAPEFFTAKGERVRSKSEIIIADALSRFEIPYRYEYPVHIPGIGTVHPDFICLNVKQRKEYIWEHNGMMSDSEYADYAVNKFEKYAFAGFNSGENLILSFESDSRPISSRLIEYLIRKYLL